MGTVIPHLFCSPTVGEVNVMNWMQQPLQEENWLILWGKKVPWKSIKALAIAGEAHLLPWGLEPPSHWNLLQESFMTPVSAVVTIVLKLNFKPFPTCLEMSQRTGALTSVGVLEASGRHFSEIWIKFSVNFWQRPHFLWLKSSTLFEVQEEILISSKINIAALFFLQFLCLGADPGKAKCFHISHHPQAHQPPAGGTGEPHRKCQHWTVAFEMSGAWEWLLEPSLAIYSTLVLYGSFFL